MWDSEYTYSPGPCPGQIIPLGLFVPHPPKNRHSLEVKWEFGELSRQRIGWPCHLRFGLFGSDLGNSPIGAVASSL